MIFEKYFTSSNYSKLLVSSINWFLKNETGKKTVDTKVLNPVLKMATYSIESI
jgi:hypothetical protein